MNFEIFHPWLLLTLLALPLLLLGQRRSLADFTPSQRRVCLAVRALILSLIALAMAGVRALLPSSELGVLFVVDGSSSISPEAAKAARDFVSAALPAQRTGDQIGVVGFGHNAEVWQPPMENAAMMEWPTLRDAKASDVGNALDFSSALFAADHSQRVVLLSDGNDTSGRALETATRLARAGVEVWTVPLRNPTKPEVLIERVNVPARLKLGEPFDLTANIRSNVVTHAKVRLYQSQFLIAQRELDLKIGDNDFRAPGLKPDGSFVQYEVEIVPEQDTAIENNRALAVASMRGQPRVLLVDGDPDKARPLAETLRAGSIAVELRGPNGAPRSLDDLQQFDLFLLSDLSALTLGREQMELYRRWVQDFGGGFVLLGGENSYGVGGYFRTPIEQMLPVRMEHNDREELPTVALLIVLDRSGSMTTQVAGQTKMSLADQGAALALNVLSARDYFGVLAVESIITERGLITKRR